MNKIVRENFPVAELPETLREMFDPAEPVRLVIEQDGPAQQSLGHFSRHFDAGRKHFGSSDEIDQHVSSMRDEWERR